MGNNICGIVINSLPNLTEIESFDQKKLKTKFAKARINGLSPKDLSITFLGDRTLIFLDMIFYKNISEEAELTDLENDLNIIFPKSRILIIAINDTVNFAGYSLIGNGVKLRTKATVNGDIFLDYGELNEKETELFNEITSLVQRKYPGELKKIDDATVDDSPVDKRKFYLKYRDVVYQRLKIENNFNYTTGSLDDYLIESEFNNLTGRTYFDIESLDFIVFERRKLNFKKDSLKEFLYLAKKSLEGETF